MTTDDKKATSTELTGGAGFTYEDTVVAYYLAGLLCEDKALGLEGKVVSVAVQRAGHGHPMDDLVVEFQDAVGLRVLGLQAKQTLRISSATSNTDFREIMEGAAATRSSKLFKKDRDAYGFVVEHTSDSRLRSLVRLINWAKASPEGADFIRRFESKGNAAATEVKLRTELLEMISASSVDDETDFYRHFVAVRLDGLNEGGPRRAEVINRLQELVVKNLDGIETLLFHRLCQIAREGARFSHKWTRIDLIKQLCSTVRLRTVPSYYRDIGTLITLSNESLQDVSETIDDFHVNRPELQSLVDERLTSYRLVNISGLPGCGKSAVLKHYAAKALKNGPILFLKTDRLLGKGWSTFASSLGLEHSAAELLAEIGATGTPILFIDGIDRIPPDQKVIITDLLHTIETHPDLQHWQVLATSRDQGLEPYRAWFPPSFYKGTGVGDIPVKTFSDEEAEVLATEKPHLRRLLFGPPAIREVARRPFFANVLTQDLFTDTTAPHTEIDLINAWWDRAGHDIQPADRIPRQRALIDLAEAGVGSLGKSIPKRKLKDTTFSQLGGLEMDKIVSETRLGGAYSFSHDIFFEWSFFRLLIELDTEWHTAVSAAGEPPLLGRVVGLLSQHFLSEPGRWSEGYSLLELQALRSQWGREWLTAPPFSPSFRQGMKEFSSLVTQDENLFEKVLVWFQAQHTQPNPIIMRGLGDAPQGIDNIRIADLLGWPSDPLGWGRMLDWLLILAPSLSVRLIPHTLEVFGVWQNAFADQRNTRSEAIVSQCHLWLIDLEFHLHYDRLYGPDDKWSVLGREARSTLGSSLRTIILRAARSYPKHACAVFARAATNDKMRQVAYSDLMNFCPIMVEVDADIVVTVAKAEIKEELPQDRFEREEREHREQSEMLVQLRAKPKSELSDKERNILDSPHLIMRMGYDLPDMDDLGIDRLHRYYYPQSALHEPFASLFRLKPEVALSFVNDLANRAVKGWRQINLIHNGGMGTPLPVTLEFPWGSQTFWGNWDVYCWSMGHQGPQPLECAFQALKYWAFQEIDKGRPTGEVIQAILAGNECYAVLGLALMLALETLDVSETSLPIASCQRLWHHDIARSLQESALNRVFFGSPARLSDSQKEANEYLEGRKYRNREIRHLALQFALSPDDGLRERFKDILTAFPSELPFEREEDRTSEKAISYLREQAIIWSGLGDSNNYHSVPVGEDTMGIAYQPPEPITQERRQKTGEATVHLQTQSILVWAEKSLEENQIRQGLALTDAVVFAQEHDRESLFQTRLIVGPHVFQSAVSAIAACVIVFQPGSTSEHEWAWDVMSRVMKMQEPERFTGSIIPWHPMHHLLAALSRDRQRTAPRTDSVERLLILTAHPLESVVLYAFQVLFQDPQVHVSWVAAQRALDLSLHYWPKISENGHQRDFSIKEEANEKSLTNALARHVAGFEEPLTNIPPAWTKSGFRQRRRRGNASEEGWGESDPGFNPQFAAKVFKLLPVEAWMQSVKYRDSFKTTLIQLVTWTNERLMPPWQSANDRTTDRQPELYEWASVLGDLLARTLQDIDAVWFRGNLLKPFLVDKDEALLVLSEFAKGTVTRHVMDAEVTPPAVFELLNDCVDRVVRDWQLATGSHRGGDISGYELPILIKALLFVVTDQNCPGSVRFANGDWSEIESVMPLVTRLMSKVGWSLYVMERFLALCERAGTAYPLDSFSLQVNSALDRLANAKGSWTGTTLPARLARAVQRLAEANYPLRPDQAQALLKILDTLIDLGDRRSVALEQGEVFREVQRKG